MKKSDLSPVENEDLNISISSYVSCILSEPNHEQYLEDSISNKDEESIISDDDPKSFSYEDDNIKLINNNIDFISQKVHNLRSEFQNVKLDSIINIMSSRNIDVYCIQETWLDGNYVKEINGYTIFHHSLTKQTCNRGQKRVAIKLSSKFSSFINNRVLKLQLFLKIKIVLILVGSSD